MMHFPFQGKLVGSLHFMLIALFLKTTLKIIIFFALFSIFLCYSSGFSWFPHSFNVYFSTFPFSFFSRALERKYMFLVCNGILAVLAKGSGSSVSSSSPDLIFWSLFHVVCPKTIIKLRSFLSQFESDCRFRQRHENLK